MRSYQTYPTACKGQRAVRSLSKASNSTTHWGTAILIVFLPPPTLPSLSIAYRDTRLTPLLRPVAVYLYSMKMGRTDYAEG